MFYASLPFIYFEFQSIKIQEDVRRVSKSFCLLIKKIGCVDPRGVESKVIFTILHVSLSLKLILELRAHIAKLIELLIIRSINFPYLNRWFTMPREHVHVLH